MPSIALLGAPHTGAEELARALQARISPDSVQIVVAPAVLPAPSQTRPAPALSATTLTLLMGLDLPCPPEDRAAQEAFDAQLRVALQDAGVAYRVIYGQGDKRVANALNAIKSIAINTYPTGGERVFNVENGIRAQRLRAWNCEKCSDPVCEHRLFTSLVEKRQTCSD
ncbi:MAG: hypothetical protein QE485_02045 [Acidovorax sp.]|uniref:hypothetical protein n=1 Tax=Acidovorax sp. TaxID=1872122 RepID=UPI00262F27B2|nr:hypothetical protein [Acidovorax sp.]MDH4415983.1 hypothetical protein [Acidovorax sp.]